MPKQPKPSHPEALQTIDPTALANVSGGASRTPAASSSSGGGGDDAVLSALTGILDSLHSLANQPRQGFGAQEMMLFMMMLQQRNSAVQVVQQPALPMIYTNGTNRVF